ncbi:MAG: hypothetical protein WBX25_04300 [Rhodomicrobium sp.]
MRQDDRGNLWFMGRKKDIIIRGGSNISPTEVERALLVHPAVEDAGVVGVPDAILGERVAGFVELTKNAPSVSASQIIAGMRGQLADYKVPERLDIVAALPRNTLGKIDRKALLALTANAGAVSEDEGRRSLVGA